MLEIGTLHSVPTDQVQPLNLGGIPSHSCNSVGHKSERQFAQRASVLTCQDCPATREEPKAHTLAGLLG